MEFAGISFVLLTIEPHPRPYMENNRTAGNIWQEHLNFWREIVIYGKGKVMTSSKLDGNI